MSKKYWSPRIQNAVPYVPGEQPRGLSFIKLNTNESPYPPSPMVLEAIQRTVGANLRLYPDPECLALRQAAARRYTLRPEQVFAGNGSDEILAFCFQAFFDPQKTILFADVTYSFYPVYAQFFGQKYRNVPLDDQLELPVEELLHSEGGVVLANPNAPTGKSVAVADIQRILEANRDVVVLVDEAYVDFGGISAISLVDKYPNLVVVRTLSKSGSPAGLRVGFAMGHPDLMNALRCVRDSINSYTLDALALAGGAAALDDPVWLDQTAAKIIRTRAWVTRSLRAMGFLVHDSAANFVFASHPSQNARGLLAGLREKGILVRWFDKPRIDNYLRITVGTDEEMQLLCRALEEILGKEG